MANLEHVGIVREGVDAIATWRMEHPDQSLDLQGANLEKADLWGASLRDADLQDAVLVRARLEIAHQWIWGRVILRRVFLP